MSATEWYWCLTHDRAEEAGARDDPDNALGPYPTPEAAADWRRLNEERALKWKLEDEAWSGDDADDA
jgi:hypothetical protein